MEILRQLKTAILVACTLAFPAIGSSQDLKPQILHPDPSNGALLYGLSDNGDWGVSCVSPGYVGFSDFAGASIYDLRSNPVKSTDLAGGETFCAGFDVTDDGQTVVGSVRQQPAVCRLENGKWVWYELPVPDREFKVRNVYTDEYATYILNGGEAMNVTPDGKYAVGYAHSVEYINLEVACMWDLETMELMEVPGLGIENSSFSRFTQISSDGRYLLGRKGGYFLYDREKRTSQSVRVGLDIYAQGMSTTGNYISGVSERNDVPYAAFWDVWENKTTVLAEDIYADAVAWCITNTGIPLIARPYFTPYADAFVYYDNFLYGLDEILTQVYGINLGNEGIDNTGKPFKVSADGRTIVLMTAPGNSYVLRLKEDLSEAVKRMDLFAKWSATPPSGTRMTAIGKVSVNFAYNVELTGEGGQIEILDADGNVVATPLASGGMTASGSSLVLQFRTFAMTPDKEYRLHIPAGIIDLQGNKNITNPELFITYTGRENVPVKPVSVSPESGSALSSISLSDNPVIITFDNKIKVNTNLADRPIAKVYIDGDTDLAGYANIDVDLNTGDRLVIFPENPIPLYSGSRYTVIVPAGAATDMSGSGASEEIRIEYEGLYVPQLGDEKYLFYSTCDDYTNFLFYEGDHGNPTAEYQEMGFTADTTPWSVVMEDYDSTDMAFGSHSQYSPLVRADDWVTTRQILIPEGTMAYLAFDSQSYRKQKLDTLKVYVYENAARINSLNKTHIADIRANGTLIYNERQDPGATEAYLSGEWRHNVIDLSEFAGKPIYICFLNENYNGSMVMIDNIEVVRDVKAFITLRNKSNVVAQSSIPIWGMLSVATEASHYSSLEMDLKDSEGNVVSSIKESGLSLTAGGYYNFEFSNPLPLKSGVENPFTIDYKLDSDEITYTGTIANLTFEPVKRVVIEEFTGRDCQFCPGGILTIEHLVSLYGDKLIPVALHCYNGSDPKGLNVMGYWEFTGMGAAPQAIVNRGPVSSPLLQTPTGYTNTGVGGEKLWKDYVADEFSEPAILGVSVTNKGIDGRSINYLASFRSALAIEDCHYRVFGVLLEDGLIDYQVNAYYGQTDPLLGEWGQGGVYGSGRVYTTFDNVARSTWGYSYNGTPGLIPNYMNPSETYDVPMTIDIPDNIVDINNCSFVVMVIDEGTGRIVNAARSSKISGVGTISDSAVEPSATVVGNELCVESDEECIVSIYDLSGRRIAYGAGSGSFSIDLNGHTGFMLVNLTTPTTSVSRKLLVK